MSAAELDSDIEVKQELPSREELKQYIQDKHRLAKELARLKQNQKTTHNKKERTGSVPVCDKLSSLIGQVTESKAKIRPAKRDSNSLPQTKDVMKPFAQVTNKYALGKAFRRLRNADGGEPSDSSEFSASSSESGSEPTSTNTDFKASDSDNASETSESTRSYSSRSSTGSSQGHHRYRSRACGKSKKAKRSKKSKSRHCSEKRRTLIKPTLPEKYGGQAEYRAFQKFLTHGTAYVKYVYVEKRRQVMVLSEFLTGQTYTFYTRHVSLAPHK
ncbi:hypothetical protein C0989_000601 [Termitomyces sp. Mn162]|nr:hypothetical protein C0989_000601 [Termitomyces sp. Mn162]KAH0588856.1 hypothetical protein H2248_004648 [Termitomyces sp. 'cryptogamus']